MTRYVAQRLHSQARPLGWYVVDLARSTRYAVVCVGGRHASETDAIVEARVLEVTS